MLNTHETNNIRPLSLTNAMREEINNDTEIFLASGGKIQHIEGSFTLAQLKLDLNYFDLYCSGVLHTYKKHKGLFYVRMKKNSKKTRWKRVAKKTFYQKLATKNHIATLIG